MLHAVGVTGLYKPQSELLYPTIISYAMGVAIGLGEVSGSRYLQNGFNQAEYILSTRLLISLRFCIKSAHVHLQTPVERIHLTYRKIVSRHDVKKTYNAECKRQSQP
ncbi:hypothetical protein EG68_04683 [Paragonimus skrjabini miyazakii]|uniref:Uncharacterized protein n=1 Tax=Paragonimus skrjabini miyazakii TaxID=59628 RepID=A0A8S9YXR3_9TREM|nr:hypothetical protein EG68_04683 [Paragonimus skrjabini miyazakii]